VCHIESPDENSFARHRFDMGELLSKVSSPAISKITSCEICFFKTHATLKAEVWGSASSFLSEAFGGCLELDIATLILIRE